MRTLTIALVFMFLAVGVAYSAEANIASKTVSIQPVTPIMSVAIKSTPEISVSKRHIHGYEYIHTGTLIRWPNGKLRERTIVDEIYNPYHLLIAKTGREYLYNLKGKLISPIHYYMSSFVYNKNKALTTENTSNYYYDTRNKLISSNQIKITYTYNATGTLEQRINRSYFYDAQHKLVSSSVAKSTYAYYENGAKKSEESEYSEYDTSGNRRAYSHTKEIYDQSGALAERYTYYASGRMESHAIYQNGSLWVNNHYYDDDANRKMASVYANGEYHHFLNEPMGRGDISYYPNCDVYGLTGAHVVVNEYQPGTNKVEKTFIYGAIDITDVSNPIPSNLFCEIPQSLWQGTSNSEYRLGVTGYQSGAPGTWLYNLIALYVPTGNQHAIGYTIGRNFSALMDISPGENPVAVFGTPHWTKIVRVTDFRESIYLNMPIEGVEFDTAANTLTINGNTTIDIATLQEVETKEAELVRATVSAAKTASDANMANFNAKSEIISTAQTTGAGNIQISGAMAPTSKTLLLVPLPVKEAEPL